MCYLLHQLLADVLTNKFSNFSYSRYVLILENEHIVVTSVGPPTQDMIEKVSIFQFSLDEQINEVVPLIVGVIWI